MILSQFQSTCPARGTTSRKEAMLNYARFQSTCPARGTTAAYDGFTAAIDISIHVPREGHDEHDACAIL